MATPGSLKLVRDFVNTLDVLPDTDKIGDPASLAFWLAEHRLVPTPPTLTDEDLGRARSLREALRAPAGQRRFPARPGGCRDFRRRCRLRALARPGRRGWSARAAPDRRGRAKPRHRRVGLDRAQLLSRAGSGPASRAARSATGRSTTAPRTVRPPGAALIAAPGSAFAATGDDVGKSPRSVSPLPRPTSQSSHKGEIRRISLPKTV